MRQLDKIILHCTATTSARQLSVKEVRKWHQARGWHDIGYHYLIHQDGTIEKGRPIQKVGAHALNNNASSVGVAYCGGVDKDGEPKDTMTKKQQQAFRDLVHALRLVFSWDIDVVGHNEYSNKACPSFKVQTKFPDLIL